MGSYKQSQEMVERASNTSPFWRSRPAAPRRVASSSADLTKVIGASYSYADMLNLETLSVTGSSRPKTPPAGSVDRAVASRTPPPKGRASVATPPRKSFNRFFSDVGRTTPSSVGSEDEDVLDFDEEEDEFGLPSIAAGKRKAAKKSRSSSTQKPSSFGNNKEGQSSSAAARSVWQMDSGDIAEERGVPNYPTAKPIEGKILRPQYQDILKDPANSLHLIHHPALAVNATPKESEAHSSRISRINKFKRILQASSVSISDLRDCAWSGIPEEVRAMSWQVLLGYLPTSSERRVTTLERKRKEYLDGVRQAFERGGSLSEKTAGTGSVRGRARGLDEAVWHQISIDVPRTNPHLKLYQYEATQRSLERILYVWAIRHPASGYVQGINDLVTPFWQTFLGAYITDSDIESGMDPGQLPKAVLDGVEADSFWCLTKLLDGIQDNYVHAQPGIQRQVAGLRDLTRRIDSGLVTHLESEGVEFIQFSFRWMNCLLMREISVKNTIRMWDTYMAEEQGFSQFHLYVCAAFLVKWSDQLIKMEFQDIMMFLQSLPTRDWGAKDIELLLSEAFIWQSLFRGSSAHLRHTESTLAFSPG